MNSKHFMVSCKVKCGLKILPSLTQTKSKHFKFLTKTTSHSLFAKSITMRLISFKTVVGGWSLRTNVVIQPLHFSNDDRAIFKHVVGLARIPVQNPVSASGSVGKFPPSVGFAVRDADPQVLVVMRSDKLHDFTEKFN